MTLVPTPEALIGRGLSVTGAFAFGDLMMMALRAVPEGLPANRLSVYFSEGPLNQWLWSLAFKVNEESWAWPFRVARETVPPCRITYSTSGLPREVADQMMEAHWTVLDECAIIRNPSSTALFAGGQMVLPHCATYLNLSADAGVNFGWLAENKFVEFIEGPTPWRWGFPAAG